LVKVKKLPMVEATEIAEHWLQRVGLADKRDAYPSQPSRGQQQRVAIARVVAMSPKLMLFDEETSALDPELVNEVLNVITTLVEDGMAMLLVAHVMQFAHDVSSKIVFMHEGQIAEQGTPENVLRNPTTDRLIEFVKSSKLNRS
jgi:polar amino acid transport system ATP-binding protein